MSLSELIERFGTEAQCEAALERARWPDGFVCPSCGGREHSTFLADGRKYWQCSHCRAQTTVRSGTLFHSSKLPLTKWFQAIYLVTQNKNGLASFASAGAVVAEHGAIIVSPHRSSDLGVFDWVNTFIANLKTAIDGTYHHFAFKKYGTRYLAEAQYRVNRRFELRSLVDRLLWTCARTIPCSEDWLRLGLVRG